MQSLKSRTSKAAAVVLVLAVAHMYVNAELVRAASARLFAGVMPQATIQGRLTTRGNNPVTVNGNSARSGETIFSGQSIQTPDGVGATINLPGLGSVDMSTNTNITLTFEHGKINVKLVSGCVVLTAYKGTTGTLEEGDRTRQTDPAKGGTIENCGERPAGATIPAATGGIGTLGKAGIIIAAAGAVATAAALIPCRRGDNPSPFTPGGGDACN